jgi:thiol:disulfide interchange protein DsbA
MNPADSMRMSRTLRASFLAVLIAALGACGSDEPTPQATQEIPATPKVATATTPSKSSNDTSAVPATGDETTATPEQISETGDGVESVGEAPTSQSSTPVLKLAAAATPEPKGAPSAFKEGVHYQLLVPTQPSNAPPGQIEVVEVFWYGCSHCFALDPKLETWRQKDKPSYVAFHRVPATWNDATQFHGRLFYAAEMLGKLDELHTPLFREIHLNGNPLNTMDKGKAFFTAHGVAKADFDKVFTSFGLESKLQNAVMLNKRYRVQSVPFFVVNGKYTADVSSAGGEEQLLKLLSELAAREHGG